MTFYKGQAVVCIHDRPFVGRDEAVAPNLGEIYVVTKPVGIKPHSDWLRVRNDLGHQQHFLPEHFASLEAVAVPPTQAGAEEYEEIMQAQDFLAGSATE